MSYVIDLNKQKKQKSVLIRFHFISWPANIKDHLNYMCPHFTSMQMTQLCFYYFSNTIVEFSVLVDNFHLTQV